MSSGRSAFSGPRADPSCGLIATAPGLSPRTPACTRNVAKGDVRRGADGAGGESVANAVTPVATRRAEIAIVPTAATGHGVGR
jgi:hypothetical protein